VDENWAWAWNLLKILDEDKSIKLRDDKQLIICW